MKFLAEADYSVGEKPVGVAVGDFDGDGSPDLATANAFGETVSILLGKGDGTFKAKVDYVVATGPTKIVVGDFNGDKVLDVATSVTGGDTVDTHVSILLGKGDGTFKAESQFSLGGSAPYKTLDPRELVTSDFNGDGKLDLATANFGTFYLPNGSISLLLGVGDGTFKAPALFEKDLIEDGARLSDVVTGDFNGDGRADLAAPGWAVDSVNPWGIRVFLGNGDGSFVYTSLIVGNFGNLATGDFDGDGRPDMAATGETGDGQKVYLCHGNGDGTFGTPTALASSSAKLDVVDLVAQDLNGDGERDLVAMSRIPAFIAMWMGKGDGTFDNNVDHKLGAAGWRLTTGDFNGDGKLDLVRSTSNNTVNVVLNGACTP